MSLRDELATILREHVSDADGACEVCDILLADDEWENHVVGLQIAYLRDNLAQHGDELRGAREVLKPLRELHKPITFVGVTCCQNCRTPSGSAAAWPCATAQLIYPEDELT